MTSGFLQKFYRLLESYLFIGTFSIFVGIVFSEQFSSIAFLSTFMLQIIFFLSSLKIELAGLVNALKDFKSLFVVNAFMMIVLPILVYFIARTVVPDFAIALLLLAAMSSGMTTPLLTEVVGGNVDYSLVLTVTTSLLAPITVPLVLKALLGASVELSFIDMFLKLSNVIVIPFILAQIIKRYFHPHIKKSFFTFKPISLLLLGLLIAVLVAQNAQSVLQDFNRLTYYLLVVCAFFILLHLFGFYLTFWQSKKDRLTVTVGVTYMNFVLALYIAGIYFNDPIIILTIVTSIIPWTLFLMPFKKIFNMLQLSNNT